MFERFKNRPADPDSTATTSRDRPAGNGRAHGTERPTGAATRREETGERTRDQMRATRARQREEYGGVNWGAAFFGWLVAVGLGAARARSRRALRGSFGHGSAAVARAAITAGRLCAVRIGRTVLESLEHGGSLH